MSTLLHSAPARAVAVAGAPDAVSMIDAWGRGLAILVAAIWAGAAVLGFQWAMTTLVVLGFALAVLGLWRPLAGMIGVAILCALDTPSRVYLLVGGLLRFNTFNYWLLAVAVLSLGFLRRARDPHTVLLKLFAGLLVVELLLSANLTFGMQHVLNLSAAFGLLAYFAPAVASPSLWYWTGVTSGVLGAGGGLVFYLQRTTLPPINANAWALFPLTALFAICLAFPSAAEVRRGRLVLVLLAVVNWAWVFLSASRGGLLLATVCLLFLILLTRGVGGRLGFLVVAAVLGFAVSTQFTDLQASTLHRIDRLLNSEISLVGRTSGRSELVRGGWAIFVKHPVTGVGTGGFAAAWADLGPELRLAFGRGQEFQSHSAWLKVLAENGVPGIVLFAAYVGSFAVVGLRALAWPRIVLGLLVTVALTVAFTTTEFQAKGLWFLAAGATTLLHRERFAALLRRSAPE